MGPNRFNENFMWYEVKELWQTNLVLGISFRREQQTSIVNLWVTEFEINDT